MFSTSTSSAGRGFVKICGVTNVDDANLCAQLGADAIGMLLTKPGQSRESGSDRLDRTGAAALAAALPAGLKSVLLVHATDLDEMLALADEIQPSALQVQRAVAPETLLRVKESFPGKSIIKTFPVERGAAVDVLEQDIRRYVRSGAIDAILLDGFRGGSGEVHDWDLSRQLVARFPDTPTILAGGLNAENVALARATVRPYGVDVMTGVTFEEQRDRKDPGRLRAFLAACNGRPDQ